MITNERLKELIDDLSWKDQKIPFTREDKEVSDSLKELLDLRKENAEQKKSWGMLARGHKNAMELIAELDEQKTLLIKNSERLVYVLEAVIENHHITGVEYDMCKQNIDKSTATMKQVKG